MSNITEKIAERSGKCACCGEYWRKHERCIVVEGERSRYCVHCRENVELMFDDGIDHNHERQMEDYAAYRAAGCINEYWTDRDAGYAY